MKTMRRVSRGRSFLGLMTYLLRRDAEHRQQPGVPIGGTVCGTTARDIARELRSAAQQRPDIIKPVWHQALRLPQGERLPPLTWCRIAEVFMEEMGFDTAQQPYAVVLHDDPQGQHIHIEHFQFETLCDSNHTAWRFAEKTRFFRSLLAGRRCAAASHFAFYKGKML